ncbi:MAG: DUF3307 domain-containing protein [Dehalococcoidales bacterium]|nr:DUF3307 domain-containing protein [Dehalococcoidales bacterium]
MWVELFLCLLLAHLVADFALQTSESCKSKREKKWRSDCHYIHAATVFALSWLASFCLEFWWCALVITIAHFAIDIWKSYREDKVKWFVIDQFLHIAILAIVAWQWCRFNEWSVPFGISTKYIALAVAIIVCWKPANIFIKLILKHYSVNMPEAHSDSGFNAGALIGDIERWLILAFVIMQRYEALGLLIAAKSIIRFGDKETAKTEYVLAGTLMSIFIAVLSGLMVTLV